MSERYLTVPLADLIYDENALCDLLKVNKNMLGNLRRQKDLPAVHLAKGKRVYLADDVLEWLRGLRKPIQENN